MILKDKIDIIIQI